MARRVELLNGGLVTVRDKSLLRPGELSFLRNAVYRAGSPALWRATGRVAAGTASADPAGADIVGLRDMQFDNGIHVVVAHASSFYVTGTLADTITFGTVASGVGVGSQLEVVQYRNRFFLFNGTQAPVSASGSNRVLYLSATSTTAQTSRQHGMVEVLEAPFVTASATAFSQSITGYYEYWTTEVAKFTQDSSELSLESTFAGNPETIFVTSTGMAPVITPPPLVNPGFTTHWRVYRSPKKDKQSDKKFPTGFMVAEMGTGTATGAIQIVDGGGATSTGFVFPGSQNSGGNLYAQFSNATGLTADDGVYSTAAITFALPKSQAAYNYNFGGFSGNIKGIEVAVQASALAYPVQFSCRIGRNRNASDGGWLPSSVTAIPAGQVRQLFSDLYMKANTAAKSALLTATDQVMTFGGSSDRWFPADNSGLVDTDFGPNFMVQMNAIGNTSVAMDYIKVKVYFGTTIDSVIQFPTVAYTFGDITAQVGKNGKPPSSSTGDVYEDQLVVNDVTNPGLIRYSYPGDPESFPSTYYLDFETRSNDRVTNIKVVNQRLIVMLRNSVYRCNYLPSERDASFDRGKAIEPIARDFGCVNEMCAATFTMDGTQERLAFVADTGIFITDGYTTNEWTADLDWRGSLDGFGIANQTFTYTPIALINNAEEQRLEFLFRSDAIGFGGNHFSLMLHYNDRKPNGLPRISGFVTMRNTVAGVHAIPKSTWPILRSNGIQEVFLGYGASGAGSTGAGAGQIWRTTGTTIPSSLPAMRWNTRRMYLAGMGREWKLNELYGYTGLVTYSTPPSITYRTDNVKTNGVNSVAQTKTYTYPASPSTLHKVIFNQAAEGLMVLATASGEADFGIDQMIIDGEDFGLEDGGL